MHTWLGVKYFYYTLIKHQSLIKGLLWGIGYQFFLSREIYTQPLSSTYKNFARFQISILSITLIFANLTNVSIMILRIFFCCQPIMSVILDFLIHCLVLDIFKLNNVCLFYLTCFIMINERTKHNHYEERHNYKKRRT